MSKKDKLYLRFKKKPSPVDFTWEEFIALIKSLGFKETCTGGSHYMFEHTSGFKFGVSKTHPSGLLKKYQFKDVITALKEVGECKENGE